MEVTTGNQQELLRLGHQGLALRNLGTDTFLARYNPNRCRSDSVPGLVLGALPVFCHLIVTLSYAGQLSSSVPPLYLQAELGSCVGLVTSKLWEPLQITLNLSFLIFKMGQYPRGLSQGVTGSPPKPFACTSFPVRSAPDRQQLGRWERIPWRGEKCPSLAPQPSPEVTLTLKALPTAPRPT